MQNRFVVQKLRKFALKEYNEKRPTEVFGLRVKKAILLQRGFGPSIILSGLKGKAVPYLILENYGDHYRLYYFLENGVILNAINIPTNDFEQELPKFQKATTILFQIPKPIVPEKRVEKIKKQINDRFQQYVSLIEKQTSCKVKNIPLITIYQSPVEAKLIIKREANFIKLPVELVSHKLIDGFLAREAYRQLIPAFIHETKFSKILELIGAYIILVKTLKQDWVYYWESKIPFKDKLTQMNESVFNAFLRFLCYFAKYESSKFSDIQFEKLFSLYPELLKKTENLPEIAAECYLQLGNHEGYFILKATFFFILANRFKDARQALKELAKFTQPEEIELLRIQSEHLVLFRLAKIYSNNINLASYPPDFQELFKDTLNHVKSQVLEVKRIHKQKAALSKPITIKIFIKNLTDITFSNIRLTDNFPKKAQVEIKESNTFYFSQIRPNQEVTCEYQISSSVPQKMRFNNGNLTFEDIYDHHYVQPIPISIIQFQ